MAIRRFKTRAARRLLVASLIVAGVASGFALDQTKLRGVTADKAPRGSEPTRQFNSTSEPTGVPGGTHSQSAASWERSLSAASANTSTLAPPPVDISSALGERHSAPPGPLAGPFADGLSALRRGDAHAAALSFEEARRRTPHSPEILVNLGFAYLELFRPMAATEVFMRANGMAPTMPAAYFGLAESLEASGDLEGARGAMRTFLHLAPEDDRFRRRAMAALWEWSIRRDTDAGPPPDTPSLPEPARLAEGSRDASLGVMPVYVGARPLTSEDAPFARIEDTAGELAENAVSNTDIFDAPLSTLNGAPATLAPHRGRLLVLNIWAAWCGPCRMELPSLERLAMGLDPARAAVVGVSMDERPILTREFLRETGIGFTNLWDAKRELTRRVLDIRALPVTLIVAPDGAIIVRHEGALDWAAPEVASAVAALAEPHGATMQGIARLEEAVR